MRRTLTVFLFGLAAIDVAVLRTAVDAFQCPSLFLGSSSSPTSLFESSVSSRTRQLLLALKSDDNSGSDDSSKQQQQPDPVEAFMEEASQKGADKVRSMSIEERTRRAMLAEAMEDRIFSMYDELEGLLETDGTVPTSEENREEIKNLAQEIKASQSQYEDVMTGRPSAMLGTINGIGTNSSSADRRKEEDE